MQDARPDVQIIPASGCRRERWRNGLGWTRAITAWPDARDWQWRLSVAEIEQAADWSAFPGMEREQVLLEGDGLRLDFADGEVRTLEPPHGRVRFAGEAGVRGTPVAGRVEVFNLMWRRDAFAADLRHRSLNGPMPFAVDAGEGLVLYLLAGRAQFDHPGLPPLMQGDTALLLPAQRHRCLLDGTGALLEIRLRAQGATLRGAAGSAGPSPVRSSR